MFGYFIDYYWFFNFFLYGVLCIISFGFIIRLVVNNINVYIFKLKFYIELY